MHTDVWEPLAQNRSMFSTDEEEKYVKSTDWGKLRELFGNQSDKRDGVWRQEAGADTGEVLWTAEWWPSVLFQNIPSRWSVGRISGILFTPKEYRFAATRNTQRNVLRALAI